MRTSHSGRAVTARSPQLPVSALGSDGEYRGPSGPAALVIAEPPVTETVDESATIATRDAEPETSTAAELASDDLHARISERAYHLYLARNGEPGDEVSDWLQAEKEIKRETLPAVE